MRAVVVSTLALLTLGFASAAGGGPAGDLVAGTGERQSLEGGPLRVHVDAHSGPAGADPQGRFRVTGTHPSIGPFAFEGTIVCLTVSGNKAAARGVVEEGDLFPPGEELVLQFTDNGSPGKGNDSQVIFFGDPPPGCPIATVDEPVITHGNFVVEDR